MRFDRGQGTIVCLVDDEQAVKPWAIYREVSGEDKELSSVLQTT